MMKFAVSLRGTEAGDLDFLRLLYASTRTEEMAPSGWSAQAIEAFLAQQFHAQHQYYQAHFPDAEFSIIEQDGQACGRLYLFWGQTTLNLIDIALLPPYRGQGLGTRLLTDLLQRADDHGLAVELSVEPYNPALRLYARFGFQVINTSGVYLRMRRQARASASRIAS
ncbi:GNAT family N-acetyltransferase [Pseudomonas donghuensis]|uniref:GNAT family N-acetyltransferase n=1 Tax=Pseudomonas donghuensis TaxID=1163398 RepID=UPI0039DF59BD